LHKHVILNVFERQVKYPDANEITPFVNSLVAYNPYPPLAFKTHKYQN